MAVAMDVADRTSITSADDAAHLGPGDINSSMIALIKDDHADEKSRRDRRFAPAFLLLRGEHQTDLHRCQRLSPLTASRDR
jgi:hypothetical protein